MSSFTSSRGPRPRGWRAGAPSSRPAGPRRGAGPGRAAGRAGRGALRPGKLAPRTPEGWRFSRVHAQARENDGERGSLCFRSGGVGSREEGKRPREEEGRSRGPVGRRAAGIWALPPSPCLLRARGWTSRRPQVKTLHCFGCLRIPWKRTSLFGISRDLLLSLFLSSLGCLFSRHIKYRMHKFNLR